MLGFSLLIASNSAAKGRKGRKGAGACGGGLRRLATRVLFRVACLVDGGVCRTIADAL